MFVFLLTFFLHLRRIVREQPFLGGVLSTHRVIPNQGVLPHNPSRLFTLSVFYLHKDAFLNSNIRLLLCSSSVFVGESLQLAHLFGDILPLRVRVTHLFGLEWGL